MAVSTYVFHNFVYQLAHGKNIDMDSDAFVMQLHTSVFSPVVATMDFQSDLDNECPATGNYVTGGAALGTLGAALVESTGAPNWAAATPYTVGQMVAKVADNGHIYRCVVAGTTHADTEPTWPTGPGLTVVDNEVTWAECGSAYVKWSFAAAEWLLSTIAAQYAVIIDTTPGAAATNPLVAYIDFGAVVSTTDGTFTVTPDAVYGLIQFPLL